MKTECEKIPSLLAALITLLPTCNKRFEKSRNEFLFPKKQTNNNKKPHFITRSNSYNYVLVNNILFKQSFKFDR